MTTEITMPRLSETMNDGKIVSWNKKTGDRITKGEIIAEVETDKANMEIEAVDSGTLSQILVLEGSTAKVGMPIAVLNGKVETKAEIPAQKPQPAQSPVTLKEEETNIIKSSPTARKLAGEKGVDISLIQGTGPGGRITEEDVYKYLDKTPKKQEEPETEEDIEIIPLSRMRNTIAQRMTWSKQNIPHFYVTYSIKADSLLEYYERSKSKIPELTLNDIFVKAVALTLKKHPFLNAEFREDHIAVHKKVNIGIAFAVDGKLLVPIVHDADQKSLNEISQKTLELKDKVKNDKLQPEDLAGGTFSISNMGMFGVKEFIAIINPPQSAGLAIGTIEKEPVVENKKITVGNIANLTISVDHRVTDGAEAAKFMQDLKDILENPANIEG